MKKLYAILLLLTAVNLSLSAQYTLIEPKSNNGIVSKNSTTVEYPTSIAPPLSGAGTRLMWIPARSAFRVGTVTGAQWDQGNIGVWSFASGYNTTASGLTSTAMGEGSIASNSTSTAMGNTTLASGSTSTAMGNSTIARGGNSTAMGSHSIASGVNSTAMGSSSIASGSASTAMGSAKATGYTSTAMGNATFARGGYSTAMGNGSFAPGGFSTAMGDNTTAQAYNSLAIGRYNVASGDSLNWIATDPLFVIGNGTATTPSNALTVLKNGNVGINTNNPCEKLVVVGNIFASGLIAGYVVCSSDIRYKKNIKNLSHVMTNLSKIQGVSYDWRRESFPDKGFNAKSQIGFIAQEVEKVFPDMVETDAQGYKSVNYIQFTPLMLEAIKEQQSKIENLQALIESLQKEKDILKADNNAMKVENQSFENRLTKLEASNIKNNERKVSEK